MLKYHFNIYEQDKFHAQLTHISLESFLWDIGKQCKTRSDAAKRSLSFMTWIPGLEVINLEFFLKLKIKRNDLLLADTCPQAANHCA